MLQGTLEKEKIVKVVKLLEQSKSILFITGAGISADSGLPTYRGRGGIYNNETTEEGIPVESVMAAEMLESRPEVTWKYLAKLEERCRGATFNRAHEVIAEMERHFKRVWVLTQNIDGFHYAAGSKNVIDIHGNVHSLRCMCCRWKAQIEDFSKISIPPVCPECNSVVRPDVVFFGEELPHDKVSQMQDELSKGFDIYFSVGTTSVFPYIKGPIVYAQHLGRPTVEINPETTEISDIVDIKISSGAAEALEKIWNEYKKGDE